MNAKSMRETFDRVTKSRIRMPSNKNINITKRILSGEKSRDVAKDIGVSVSAINKIANSVLFIAFRSYGDIGDIYVTTMQAKTESRYWLDLLSKMENVNQ